MARRLHTHTLTCRDNNTCMALTLIDLTGLETCFSHPVNRFVKHSEFYSSNLSVFSIGLSSG